LKKVTDLVNWREHRIGTDRAFQEFMDAGGWRNCRQNNIVPGFHCGRELMMAMDLFLIDLIRRWQTFKAIPFH
jgi:hypothetical protein